MFGGKAKVMRERALAGLGGALLLIAILAAYANHFHNSFHFDDAHTIENNASIRELRNIPQFFRDATTFSSLPSNQSYRPLVSTLFAIDYAIGGLNSLAYHLSIFALFIALVLLLAFVIKHLIGNPWIAFAATALYGLHPANADTVNYAIASAEIISTLGIVASAAIYFAFPNFRRYYLFALPTAIAILAKPPAAIFPVLFATYLFLFPESGSKRRLWEIAVPTIVCALLLLFVQHMTPQGWVAGARDAHNYLITQPYVALLYFKTFFWPNDLSADYDLNPFASTNDPRFWAGVIFVVLLVTMSTCHAVARRRRILAARLHSTRVIAFGLLWFLICLLPTSLFPLAEVMNDHRTFLPYIGLTIALAGTVALLLQVRIAQRKFAQIAIAFAIALVLCTSGYATFQRNKVWKTEETLWRDVVIKSPRNGRGLMNYGNTLMAKGNYKGALDHFHRAQQFTPQYSVLLINLAIAEDATKQSALAEQHFKEALRLAPSNPDSYTYYARYLLSHARGDEAYAFLQSALELSPTDLTARNLLAQANGQVVDQTAPQTPEYYLSLSLQFYDEERYVESIVASRRALDLRPGYAEAWNNICAANNKLGRYQEAAAACEQALLYKPDFQLARNNLQYAKQQGR
jgi:tetratricopeptide (TPR) repeat protein